MSDETNVYEWVSTGGDALCDAMSGLHYGAEPSRPHPNCNCTIEQTGGEHLVSGIKVWHESHEYIKSGPGDLQYNFVVTFGYTVQCPDGSGQSGTVSVTRDYELIYQTRSGDMEADSDELFDDMMQEARAEVESIKSSLNCPGPAIV
jgi:hypothetical protein